MSWEIGNTKTLSQKALEIAISQIGQKENPLGSNWGHPVQDYLASVNITFPAAWCYAFQYWCFDQASHQLNIRNPLIKTGSVLKAWNTALPSNKVKTIPQSGDIFIMSLGGGLGHCGIIESIQNNELLTTIEGNTNDTGSREGIEVERKNIRKTSDKKIIGYLRYG